jgi:hypothetical protein
MLRGVNICNMKAMYRGVYIGGVMGTDRREA